MTFGSGSSIITVTSNKLKTPIKRQGHWDYQRSYDWPLSLLEENHQKQNRTEGFFFLRINEDSWLNNINPA